MRDAAIGLQQSLRGDAAEADDHFRREFWATNHLGLGLPTRTEKRPKCAEERISRRLPELELLVLRTAFFAGAWAKWIPRLDSCGPGARLAAPLLVRVAVVFGRDK